MVDSKPHLLDQKYVLHNGLQRSLSQMESHSEEIEPTKQFAGIINYFQLYKISNYDKNLLLKLYGILHINAFGIDVYDEKHGISHCASGLYVEGSVFDHCCSPNACASGEGLTLEIRAMKQIDIGEQIFIDYVQNILPKIERQSILNERYFFVCQCFRCQSDFDQSIDYEKFKVLEQQMDCLTDDKKRYLNCKQRYEFFRAYYHNFHSSLTYFLFIYLKYKLIVKNSLKLNRNDIEKLITEVDTNLKVTHGIQHTFYNMFISLTHKNNFKIIALN